MFGVYRVDDDKQTLRRDDRSQPQPRSPSDLQSDSKTLCYELGMLIRLAQEFSALERQADSRHKNA